MKIFFVFISLLFGFSFAQSPVAERYTDTAISVSCGKRADIPITLTLENEPGSSVVTGTLLLVSNGQIEQADFRGDFNPLGFLEGVAYIEEGDYLLQLRLGFTEGNLEGLFTSMRMNVCNAGTPEEYRIPDAYYVILTK